MKITKPTKKRIIKRKVKRTYKKKDERPKTSVNVGLGFPKRMVVKMKYYDDFQLTSALGALVTHNYNLNGLWDPDRTGFGHQPMYFDQYMAIYSHYHVIGCKMTVTFTPHEANVVPTRVVLFQNDDGTIAPTSINSMQEQSVAKGYTVGSGGDSKRTVSLNWSAKKVFGGSVLANLGLQGTVSTNPPELSVGTIGVQSTDGTNTVYVSVSVAIEYIAVFSELRDIDGS